MLGFKSYKEMTWLDPFHPATNLVVGRNGSGKSNFFWAIRFVLGDAYSSMTRQERQALLHDGQGSVLSAFVEITFDNSDHRFPTGKDVVALRRTIGLKKDEYSLDRKTVSKSEVNHLLEAAGFSRSNPYYIVPQGRITSLTNAKDSDRLLLLKQVAGTKVYESKRLESLKIMQETNSKRDQITELLEYIEGRLEELQDEKSELEEFLHQDRERRCLEYAVYAHEQQNALDLLDILDEDSAKSQEYTIELYKRIADRKVVMDQLDKDLLEKKAFLKVLALDRDQFQEDISFGLQQAAQLDISVQDHLQNADSFTTLRESLVQQKNSLQNDIQSRLAKLDQWIPQFEVLVRNEETQKARLEQVEHELKLLSAKQGRHDRFKNAEERDDWLKSTLIDLEKAKIARNEQLEQLAGKNSMEELEDCKSQLDSLRNRLEGRRGLLDQVDKDLAQSSAKKEEYEGERKNLWREDAKSSTALDTYRQSVEKYHRNLFSSIDRNTSRGLESVRKIVSKFDISGYYGALYELFSVDESFYTAVDTIAGSSLFHIVVDTDETATKILNILTKERGGRVTFMPLNRLKPKPSTYPPSDRAVSLLSQLNYEDTYHLAMVQVFGKAILAPSLKEASELAKTYKLTGITFEGDRADQKGALSGGYQDYNTNRLETIGLLKSAQQTMVQHQENVSKVKSRLIELEADILKLRDSISVLESKKRTILVSREPLVHEIQVLETQVSKLEKYKEQEELHQENLRKEMQQLDAEMKSCREEIGSRFERRLNATEINQLETLPGLVQEAQHELGEIIELRVEMETRKSHMEISVNTDLKPSLSVVIEKLKNLDEEVLRTSQVGQQQTQLDLLQTKIQVSKAKLKEIEQELEDGNDSILDISKRIEKHASSQHTEQKQVDEQHLIMQKYMTKRSVLNQKKETALRHIRDLGVLPDEAFEKYNDRDPKKLLELLHNVNESLQKYSHVNKKAFEQYENFTKQRQQLEIRKEELDESAKSIEQLIGTLDQRKNEAIDRTFSQVAQFFQQVWKRLVPTGEGQLVMISAEESESQSQDQSVIADSQDERYVGISLNVAFTVGQQLRMPQLSGGQKSLVALALIFAIQKCDPAPFYLFDEIDAALDTQYRLAVADMVKELSQDAQFIITTFRPEMISVADKFYGVTFAHKVSKIQNISRNEAEQFVQSQIAPTA